MGALIHIFEYILFSQDTRFEILVRDELHNIQYDQKFLNIL